MPRPQPCREPVGRVAGASEARDAAEAASGAAETADVTVGRFAGAVGDAFKAWADLPQTQAAASSAASETYTSVSAPIQHAACVAFDGGEDIEAYLATSRTVLSALAEHVSARLTQAGAEMTLRALELGAGDCVGKPADATRPQEAAAAIGHERQQRAGAPALCFRRRVRSRQAGH